MEELIVRITGEAGIEPAVAAKAVGMILAFLRKEGPQSEVDALFSALPGAAEAAAGEAVSGASGGLLGAIGGGLMGLAGKLSGLGLSISEMQTIGRQLFAYAREKAGDETLGRVAAAIPGLSQFICVS